jgi:orotate phosphoribosyltransferase
VSSSVAPRHPALVEHLRTHSVRRGDFVLKSGARSSFFVDAKQTLCRPEGIVAVAEAFFGELDALGLEPDAIGGLTMGADPVAFGVAAIGALRGRPLRSFSVRKEPKDRGVGGRVAGALLPGDRVVVVEDTVTRGVSMLEAAEAVREAGASVVLLLAVVDRAGLAGPLAASEGLRFASLVDLVELGLSEEASPGGMAEPEARGEAGG